MSGPVGAVTVAAPNPLYQLHPSDNPGALISSVICPMKRKTTRQYTYISSQYNAFHPRSCPFMDKGQTELLQGKSLMEAKGRGSCPLHSKCYVHIVSQWGQLSVASCTTNQQWLSLFRGMKIQDDN